MDTESAKTLLSRVTMRDLRSFEHHHGIAWKGTLLLDGTPVFSISQAGRGGSNDYHFFLGRREGAALMKQLAEAGVALGLDEIEPVDALTSAMENGTNAYDAVAAVRVLDAEFATLYGEGT